MRKTISSGLAILLAGSMVGCATSKRLKREEIEARQKLYDKYEIIFEEQNLMHPFGYFFLGGIIPSERHWVLDTSRLDRTLSDLQSRPTNMTVIINQYIIDGVNYEVEKDTNFPDRIYLKRKLDLIEPVNQTHRD